MLFDGVLYVLGSRGCGSGSCVGRATFWGWVRPLRTCIYLHVIAAAAAAAAAIRGCRWHTTHARGLTSAAAATATRSRAHADSWGLLHESTEELRLEFRGVQALLESIGGKHDVVVDPGGLHHHGGEKLERLKRRRKSLEEQGNETPPSLNFGAIILVSNLHSLQHSFDIIWSYFSLVGISYGRS